MKKESIYNIAWNIRKEVEQCQKRGYFTSFPNGFCALSSIWIYDILCKKSHFVEIRFRYYFNFANSTIFHYFVVVVDVDVAKILY